MKEKIDIINVKDLHPFPDNPFGVRNDEAMKMLVESVSENGILLPLLVRRTDNGYEIISGHRRLAAAKVAGLTELPVIVEECDRDQAVIMLVDSNLQRPELLPSEKAFAFKMKNDALKRKAGRHPNENCAQPEHNSEKGRTIDKIASESEESRATIQRYIRLTNLEKPLLDLVDGGIIALTPAVELSFLTRYEQRKLLDAMEYEDCTPSYSQAVRLRKFSEQGSLDERAIYDIMSEEKANQKEKISLRVDKIEKYFPKDYTAQDMENTILKLLETWQRQRNRDRGAR